MRVRCGRHELQLEFFGYRGPAQSSAVHASATLAFESEPNFRYRVSGLVAGEFATLWIEDAVTGAIRSERLRAELRPRASGDPLIGFPRIK